MLFSSLPFILGFLPLTLAGYAVAGRFRRLWLLLASLAFYACWNPRDLPILGGSILLNNAALLLLTSPHLGQRARSATLWSAIGANLLLLGYYKYSAALADGLGFPGLAAQLPDHGRLPLGISFFTFTQIALLLGGSEPGAAMPRLLDHALFVTFFPHLIAGPLLHHQETMPQFARLRRLEWENLAPGVMIFAIGLLKKSLIADRLGGIAGWAFADPGALHLGAAWKGALAYSFQLYFDFSGYSDMAIGAARLFGVRFPANFNSPYKAESVIDYWQRWHITLTRYLTRHVYAPMALRLGRRCGAQRRARLRVPHFVLRLGIPVMTTMTLAGAWHGAGLTFLAFGVLHGLFLCINHAWRHYRPARLAPRRTLAARIGRVTLTYLCVLAGAVLFRSESLHGTAEMLAGMAGLHGTGPESAVALRGWALILVAGGIAFLTPNTQQIMRRAAPVLGEVGLAPAWIAWRPSLGWAALCGGACALGLLATGRSAEFLYFQF